MYVVTSDIENFRSNVSRQTETLMPICVWVNIEIHIMNYHLILKSVNIYVF